MSKRRRKKSQHAPQRTPQAAAIPAQRAIITPMVDLLCCGGLSFVGISLYLLWRLTLGQTTPDRFDLTEITILAALVNWPHFMASYRLLYSSKLQIVRHKWASIGVPAILLGVIAIALLTPSAKQPGALFVNEPIGFGLMLVSQFYLAWHYTGQAWGMVAAFAYIDGIRMDETERRMIRLGLRVLLVFHVFWASQDIGEHYAVPIDFETVLLILGAVGFVTLLIGIEGFRRIARRTGQAPSLRMIAPWAAIYMWYALLYVQPTALFWV